MEVADGKVTREHRDGDPQQQPPRGDRARGAAGRRGGARDDLDQAELRQGALPRPVRPRPDPSAPAGRRPTTSRAARRSWPSCARSARRIDGRAIEREAALRDEDVAGARGDRRFGMKVPEEYGGLGLTMAYYGKALMLAGSIHPTIGALLSAHQSIGVPEPVKAFGTDDQKQRFLPRCAKGAVTAFLLTEPDVGSDPARLGEHGGADRGRLGVHPRRGQALDHQRRGRRAGRGDGPGAAARRRQGRHHRVRRGDRLRGRHRREPQRLHGPQGPRERRHPLPPGAGPGGEPARPRGRGAQDRAEHAQHRPARHPGQLRGRRRSGA